MNDFLIAINNACALIVLLVLLVTTLCGVWVIADSSVTVAVRLFDRAVAAWRSRRAAAPRAAGLASVRKAVR